MAEATLNKNMIEGQIKPINGMSEELLSVFYSLDRNDFMPEAMKEMSYVEKNIILQNKKNNFEAKPNRSNSFKHKLES